jgi:phage shock protein C
VAATVTVGRPSGLLVSARCRGSVHLSGSIPGRTPRCRLGVGGKVTGMDSTIDQATTRIAAGSTSPADSISSTDPTGSTPGAGSAGSTGRIGSGGPSTPIGVLFDAPGSESSPAQGTVQQTRPRFRLHRSRTDRMIGGVCGGLAESLGVDAGVVRIGLVTLTVLGFGTGIVLYAAVWVLAPETDEP